MAIVLTLAGKLHAIFHHGSFNITDELRATFTSLEMT